MLLKFLLYFPWFSTLSGPSTRCGSTSTGEGGAHIPSAPRAAPVAGYAKNAKRKEREISLRPTLSLSLPFSLFPFFPYLSCSFALSPSLCLFLFLFLFLALEQARKRSELEENEGRVLPPRRDICRFPRSGTTRSGAFFPFHAEAARLGSAA